MNQPEGKVLGNRYRLGELIGRGGMADVYRGDDTVLDRPVAIKILTERSGEVNQALLREARSMARLNHPNIVGVYDAGEAEGTGFIVMELVSGKTLDRVPSKEITVRVAVRWFVELLDALAYAHENGIVHRDIKPANVMVLRDANLKVMDFGLSRRTTEMSTTTNSGEIVGTIAYLAPERFLGKQADARSDLYSVGVVMYEVFTGRVPFRSESDDLVSVIFAHVNDLPQPPRALNPACPPAIETLILKLLEKEPASRPESARAVADELRALLANPNATSAPGTRAPGAAPARSATPPPADPGMRKALEAAFGPNTQSKNAAAGNALAAMLASRKRDYAEGARAYRAAMDAFKKLGDDAEWAKNVLGFATMILQKNSETERPDRKELDDAEELLREALPVLRGRKMPELESGERVLYSLSRVSARRP